MNLIKTFGLCIGLSALLIGCDKMQPGSDEIAVNDTPTPVSTNMGQGSETMEITEIEVESEPADDTMTDAPEPTDSTTMPSTDTDPNDMNTMPADDTMPTPDNTMQY